MEEIEYRAVVKFLEKEGKTAHEIYKRLFKVYKRDAPKLDQIKMWLKEESQPKYKDMIPRSHVLKLINMYEKHPIMWNYRLPTYNHAELRTPIYRKMARELNTSVEVVTKKIHNLRSQWQTENRKIKQRNEELEGGQVSYVSTWWAYNRLKFLDDEVIQQTPLKDTQEKRAGTGSRIKLPIHRTKVRRMMFRPEGDKLIFLPEEKDKLVKVKKEPDTVNCASTSFDNDDFEIKIEPVDDFETEDNKDWAVNIQQFSEQGS